MMRKLTVNVATATLVFIAVTLVWQGLSAWDAALFGAIVFAMGYGAIQVALVVFGGQGK
jgi:hypothetical protein